MCVSVTVLPFEKALKVKDRNILTAAVCLDNAELPVLEYFSFSTTTQTIHLRKTFLFGFASPKLCISRATRRTASLHIEAYVVVVFMCVTKPWKTDF